MMGYGSAMLIPITDPDDARIEPYRDVRERDLVGRGDRFVVEGEVVLRVFLTRSRFAAESLLIAENRVAGLTDLMPAVPPGTPVYVASRGVMDTIVGFPIHRGILAIGRRGPPVGAEALLAGLPEQALVVGLAGIANHDNVGGIFRNAAAFGTSAVLVDSETCDPLYRKAIRVSVGGVLIVPFARVENAETMLASLQSAGFESIALSPSGREDLDAVSSAPRSALLLGAEGPGLPQTILDRMRTVRIPMRAGFDSLNVATTSGIALHHLSRAAAPAHAPAPRPRPAEM
jgi:tRNA G18 (ribose-2'-O)-methylase SpoU